MKKLIGSKGFYKMVLAICIPIVIQNGFTNLASLLDNIMIGQLGTLSMSGVSITNQLLQVFNVTIFGAMSGPGIFMAQFYGKKNKKDKGLLSGKLTPAQSKNAKKNELYLVEGDSAGGSAKQGRDRKFQAILPLRGKVLNTEKAKMADILKNEEINTMIYTIGAGVGADFNLDDINYDKIIIMTDADTDGAHIQTLLLTFFYRYMRPLVETGHVYIALPPLYKMSKGKGKKEVVEYAWTDGELEELRQKFGRGALLQRYKGLGEMNADQLWETTMNPETRTLIRVTIDDLARAERRVSVLMGDKAAPRRQWIEDNVKFTLEETTAF